MKKFKRIMALVIALAMVVAMALPAWAEGEAPNPNVPNTYTITIKNKVDGNGKPESGASIVGHTFYAYKLFDARYVAKDEDNNPITTVNGLDQGPHSYYLSTSSVFYTTSAAKTELEKYFTFTELQGDTSQVLAEPIFKDSNGKKKGEAGYDESTGKSVFTASEAYTLAEALKPYFPQDVDGSAVGSYTSGDDYETAVIDVTTKGAGYYLVTGDGHGFDQEGNPLDEADHTGDIVTSAIALTTTDPKAEIIAKLDAPSVKKEINEAGRPKYNNKGVGDTVPYIVTGKVPNMNGYEKYFYILNDTLSKGLTLNDNDLNDNDSIMDDVHHYHDDAGTPQDTADDFDAVDNGFEVKITIPAGTKYASDIPGAVQNADNSYTVTLERVADAAAAKTATNKMNYYVNHPVDGDSQKMEVVLHDFIQYKGNLIVDDGVVEGDDPTYSDYDYRTLGVDQAKVGTYYSPFTGAEITIAYSATVNEKAVIGNTGNVNTSSLVYSNNPNPDDQGTPDENTPDEPSTSEEHLTGETPDSKTVTYVTGIKLYKFTKNGAEKDPLADAEFTLVGQNLKDLVEMNVNYFRPATSEELATATHYLLKDGTYTTVPPTKDAVSTNSINKGTWRDYVQTEWGEVGTREATIGTEPNTITETVYDGGTDPWKPAYVQDTLKTWTQDVYVKDANGDHYLLKTGEFTTTAPTAQTASNYVSQDLYKKVDKDWTEMTIDEKNAATVSYTVKTDTEGLVTFTGLKATSDDATSYYKLTEIKAPDGYNMLKEPVVIKLTWTAPNKDTANVAVADDDACTWKISYKFESDAEFTVVDSDTTDLAHLFQIDVENFSGVELPSTGGIGTTIFYIVGAILVIGAGVVLITRRRMDA